jgi:hypothetical protein
MFTTNATIKKILAIFFSRRDSKNLDIKTMINEINTKLGNFSIIEKNLNRIIANLEQENSYLSLNINTLRHGLSVPFWKQELRANELINILRPSIFLDLQRVGSLNDGGYVVPEKLLSKINLAVNIGIGNETSLDQDLLNRGIMIHAYDPYIDSHPIENTKHIKFFKQGLSSSASDSNIGIREILSNADNFIDEKGNAFKCLFIDIEGSEWEHFKDVGELDLLKNFSFIVFELHDLLKAISMQEDLHFLNIVKILKQISNNFEICHISGNNSSSAFSFQNKIFPDVLELTLINKLEIFPDMERDSNLMPISLNDPNRKPYDLNNWNN